MKRMLLFLFIIIALFLTACAGKDKPTKDHTPPIPPVMIPHLGDTGDAAVMYNGETIFPDDDNNGIDAVPDGDWIKISWQHLLDTDLDYLRIYRFSDFDPQPALIDSIRANDPYYLDSSSTLSTNVLYSYYIEAVDNSGNTSLSDTVSYRLLSKQLLLSPSNEATVSPTNAIFRWFKSGDVSKFRLLIMDSDHAYVWHRDIQVANQGDTLSASLPAFYANQHTGQQMYWRVDAFGGEGELQSLEGSESHEQVFYIAGKKQDETSSIPVPAAERYNIIHPKATTLRQ